MKGGLKKSIYTTVISGALLPVILLLGGCRMLFEEPINPDPLAWGMGRLSVDVSGSQAPVANPGRTMLALSPEFSRYELVVTKNPETPDEAPEASKSYYSDTGSFQLTLSAATYNISAIGYTGDKPSARTGDNGNRVIKTEPVTVSAGAQTTASLALRPYMEDEINGTLQYSINWDGVGQIPTQAELLIEQYGGVDAAGEEVWNPIPISLIAVDASAGSRRGTVLLLRRDMGLVKQAGSLQLPPGEYRLTATVTMDGPWPPVSRSDLAHIYSNLITPAAFYYGAGDLTVTNPGLDTSSGFITRFNFKKTADGPLIAVTSVVGSAPGPDGTRLIMVQVPTSSGINDLIPVVECVPGAQVISPTPNQDTDGSPYWDTGDYSKPTRWIAKGVNGITQEYTVVVAEPAEGDFYITGIAFDDVSLTSHPVINHADGTITVVVPNGTLATNPEYELEPVISFIGTTIARVDPNYPNDPTHDYVFNQSEALKFMDGGTQDLIFRVTAKSGATKTYTVMILEAASGDAQITDFVFDGYPDRLGTIDQSAGAITVTLPFGTSLTSLKPLITYKGKLSPASGVEQNFSGPVNYTVTSEDDSNTKIYTVTVTTESANLGLFDFVITNVPRAKVVIGIKPRADGKIPIVVQVPYKTDPLMGSAPNEKTDLSKLKSAITLSDTVNSTWAWIGGASGFSSNQIEIPFGDDGDYQEAVFRVTPTTVTVPLPTQDYVVVVARDVQYYYVKATGNNNDADQYNGGSDSAPFKTLAYAVAKSVQHNVDHIFVIGTLDNTSEANASEDTSTAIPGTNTSSTYSTTGGVSITTGNGTSVFNINGTGLEGTGLPPRHIYITGVGSNAVLQGTSGKRVISITGGAHITFENITIQGGGGPSYKGDGGGIYVGQDGSKVVWKSGVITGNTAQSGGGVYLDGIADDYITNDSEFEFMSGSINGNTATGSTVVRSTFEAPNPTTLTIQGGGGVYINGDALFWQASGEINGNTAAGSGGGVLVNSSFIPHIANSYTTPLNFLMSSGSINGNTANASVWPGGGGGVYVAKGVFEMLNGEIAHNNAPSRQGGGVFVWSRALFTMDGNSSITANSGKGSSKAICNRGITIMRGNAQADSVYIWNYSQGKWNNDSGDQFTLEGGARVSGLVLAFADNAPDATDNRNYIYIAENNFTGTDRITTIDLESHLLDNGSFAKGVTAFDDWGDKFLIKLSVGNAIPANILSRFPLGSFTSGGAVQTLSTYKLDSTGKLQRK
jgi:hypothetical protein